MSATGGGKSITYQYDANGLRYKKIVNGVEHTYYYMGDKLVRLTIGDTTIMDFTYDQNGQPYAMIYNGTKLYYVLNQQGDVVRLVNSSGKSYGVYRYDAWGNILYVSDNQYTNSNPLRYRGYVYDTETQLYYCQSRYYDPALGRFLNADSFTSTGQGILGNNMFAYCNNNPVTGYDPTGELDWGTFFNGAGLVGIGITACLAAATVVSAGACTPLLIAATVTFCAGGVTTLNGTAEVIESTTGYNFMRDGVYGGDSNYYVAQRDILAATAEAGTAAISMVGNSPYVCFIAGTAIVTAEGLRAIETIEAGDLVWAWDEETGNTALKKVVETYVNSTSELVHVFVDGEEIVTTPSHPFYSPVKGWTAAVHLRAGDILQLVNGEYVVVEKVQHELLEAPVTVYNFQVEDYHTYYVSDAGVLVHNDCPRSPQRVDKRYIDSNDIDAHAFKNQAGKVPRNQLSLFDIYKDTANKGKLWVGRKNGTDWRETIYYFSELVEVWSKNGR